MKRIIDRYAGREGKTGVVLLFSAALLAAGVVVALSRIGPPGAKTAKHYLIGPSGVLEEPAVRFTWHPPEGAVRYFLELSAQDGTLLWGQPTTDTTLVAPSNLAFDPNRVYRWRITYTFADGISLSTEEEKFQVLPPPGSAP